MHKKPEIAEPESDGVVLMGCLSLPEGLRHPHAQNVLKKYRNPDGLAVQVIRTSLNSAPYAQELMKIRQMLYDEVFTHGTDEEDLSLFAEAFDEDEADCAAYQHYDTEQLAEREIVPYKTYLRVRRAPELFNKTE